MQDDCVSSLNYPEVHGNGESCSITIEEDVVISVGSTFELETCCDHLMINGVDTESSDAVPATLASGSEITWSTDGSVTRQGWQLCFSTGSGAQYAPARLPHMRHAYTELPILQPCILAMQRLPATTGYRIKTRRMWTAAGQLVMPVVRLDFPAQPHMLHLTHTD